MLGSKYVFIAQRVSSYKGLVWEKPLKYGIKLHIFKVAFKAIEISFVKCDSFIAKLWVKSENDSIKRFACFQR